MREIIIFLGHHLVVKNYQELIDEAAIQLANKYDVYLITPEKYKEKTLVEAGDFSGKHFTHIKLPTVFGKEGRQHAHFYKGLGEKIRELKPKLIYCLEEPNSLVTFQACYYARKYNARIILWSALNQYRNYKELSIFDPRKYLFPICLKYTFNNSDAINALDQSVADVLNKKKYPGKIFINNTFGVNKSFFTKPVESEEKISDELNILYVGVLENHKGVNYLIDAIDREDIHLDIIGDGSQRNILEKLAVGRQIKFHGFQNLDYIGEAMKKADVLILPSVPVDGYLEQFGRVLIEGMASGCCIAGSAIGGIPSVIGNNGLLFKHSSSAAIKEIINELKENHEKLFLLKSKAYMCALNNYSYKSVAKRLVDQIGTIINGYDKKI
ncbi:glycosyltransferase family 4 protein [Citrobacter braakii]|uniref:glycosyltransferase family 4 protein n=1 Tax=Citrobacter braakii TaxID=57706 RepID=UPI001C7D1702|nr:glycosyltransferase family 4 protein [Citrobacter braakii]HBE9119042.1 glycosyltransferase family 4 protein [Citrobacter braakii]